MPESERHKELKRKAAGESGETEKKISGKRRLDAATPKTATEIKRSGAPKRLKEAVRRLRDSKKPRKRLKVPQNDMSKAIEIAKELGGSLTVTNLSNTKKQRVNP